MNPNESVLMPPTTYRLRFFRFSLVRIVFAGFLVALAAGLGYSLASAIASKESRIAWPHLLAALAVVCAYWGYLQLVERRKLLEFSLPGALGELATGAAVGACAVATVVGLLFATDIYRFTGFNPWSLSIAIPLAEMIFVSVFEETLCRAIIFRIAEQSIGSSAALAISALLFGLAHLPGNDFGVLAFVIAMIAGLMFTFAYMLTRRLWLCIGIHAAWNYTLGSIFSITVSGHPANGWLNGTLVGPAWTTGGTYGLEGSVATLIVLSAVALILLRMVVRKKMFVSYRPKALSV